MFKIDFLGHGVSLLLLGYFTFQIQAQLRQPLQLERPPVVLKKVEFISNDLTLQSPQAQLKLKPTAVMHFSGPVDLKVNAQSATAQEVEVFLEQEITHILKPQFKNLPTELHLEKMNLWPDKPNVETLELYVQFHWPLAQHSFIRISSSELRGSLQSLQLLGTLKHEFLTPSLDLKDKSEPPEPLSLTSKPRALGSGQTVGSSFHNAYTLKAQRAEFAKTAFFVRSYFEKINFSGPHLEISGPSGRLKINPQRIYIDEAKIQLEQQQYSSEHTLINLETGEIFADQQLIGHLLP
jgi:hypothetical protein